MGPLRFPAIVVVLASATLALAAGIPLVRGVLLELAGAAVPASSGALSEHDIDELNAMPPQDQATRLIEKAVNHYAGAGEEIARRLESWKGKIHSTPELNNLTQTAYFANDLRVRAAALEIWLVRDNIDKTPEQVEDLIREASASEEGRYFRLSMLGILGNRGIEPEKVFEALAPYAHDESGSTRSGAINGLGMLGTAETIPVLLEIMHSDSSNDLRERAACNLADSGMLTRDLRQEAVPGLIRFLQEPGLDSNDKRRILQALREITQQNLRDDPGAWLSWYAGRSKR
jgi:hypothetical protein